MIFEKKNIDDLIPAPYNPRQSTKKQEDDLKKSLDKFGLVEPVIFNKRTGYIVGGHFRVRELKKMGVKEVDCVIVDLNDEDEKELNIRLNANTGQWDWEDLANNWNENDLINWGLDLPVDSGDYIQEEKEKQESILSILKLEYTKEDFEKVIEKLDNISSSREDAIFNLLGLMFHRNNTDYGCK